ncbi:cbb3-type cytochrome oxidase assembly protein CcoS [Bradyrhizobium australafricanum]|uniref:cbb3-type cytochrome oxidase assembly protein CcoS n=1 Tax=Bradyrhizobium australafricanum TaxID=2821406 RepID=UPI001CE330D2|nr:cbb3-type cytochrome oxidase assembly protein CcoS [Bradyrhizobium australafricanum]MCA6101259.1 cbb3-type cytochrome oxidase assembly protein CcoS [Bradyrhizobium australafricanum]
MEVLVYLVPLALSLGFFGLLGFLWSLKSGQYDDLDGAAWRAITDEEPNEPSVPIQIVKMDQDIRGSGRQRCPREC